MTTLSGSFTKDPGETLRFILDYTLQLSAGETVSSIAVSVTSPTGESPALLVINNIALASNGLQVVFYASAGTNGQSYEAAFSATTSIGQVILDVVKFTVMNKV